MDLRFDQKRPYNLKPMESNLIGMDFLTINLIINIIIML